MQELWAPWRLEYIKQVDKPEGCFLCRILEESNDRENLVLQRGQHAATVMNRYPYNNGHLLFAPYRHVGDICDLTRNEHLEMMTLLTRAIQALRKTIEPHGFNVGINLGRVAGAGLADHVHMHVVPRWNGDTNFMPVMADINVIPQSLLDLWDELAPELG